jgi:hypothetical protein
VWILYRLAIEYKLTGIDARVGKEDGEIAASDVRFWRGRFE